VQAQREEFEIVLYLVEKVLIFLPEALSQRWQYHRSIYTVPYRESSFLDPDHYRQSFGSGTFRSSPGSGLVISDLERIQNTILTE